MNNERKKVWLNKPVQYSFNILDNISMNDIWVTDVEEMKLIDKSLEFKIDIFVKDINSRLNPKVKISFPSLNVSSYNRMSINLLVLAKGLNNLYVHVPFDFNNDILHTASVKTNCHETISFEFEEIPRNNLDSITFQPFIMGCPPEAETKITIIIKSINFEKVDCDLCHGFIPNDIIVSHIGYYQYSNKIALAKFNNSEKFELIFKDKILNLVGKKTVFNNTPFLIMDFSNICEVGNYYISYNDSKSVSFPINKDPYSSSYNASLHFLNSLHCGEYVKGIHSRCHLNCYTVHPENGLKLPAHGGWHDAGDVSQFEICTAEMTYYLFCALDNLKNKEYYSTLDEALTGLLWLLQTRFDDGFRSLAVLYKINRPFITSTNDLSLTENFAENGPFENLLASIAEIKAVKHLKKFDESLAFHAQSAAIADFDFAVNGQKKGIFTKRWGPVIPSVFNGTLALAAGLLYENTNDDKYIKIGIEALDIVLKTIETNGVSKEMVKGFFYEDVDHKYILSFEHRAHEEFIINGLIKMSELIKEGDHFDNWQQALHDYKDYIQSFALKLTPYEIIPAGIYNCNKINLDHFTLGEIKKDEAQVLLSKQIKEGNDLGDDYYMRIFPISVKRKGFHATLLSKTKCISQLAVYLNDPKLLNLAIKQLEWILGKNPFNISSMYGIGYNFHPLYVAFSNQIFGALPVGFKTFGNNDEPYFPVINNSVYKEIWGYTTGKFIGVLADVFKMKK